MKMNFTNKVELVSIQVTSIPISYKNGKFMEFWLKEAKEK